MDDYLRTPDTRKLRQDLRSYRGGHDDGRELNIDCISSIYPRRFLCSRLTVALAHSTEFSHK